MKSIAILALAAASALPSVFAHGFVDKIVVNSGKTYKGPEPGSSVGNSIIRLIDSTDPNHIQDGKNLACGKGAATRGAKLIGDANPGDTLSFNWNAGDGSPWPHDSGPIITYMAQCDGDCTTFDATQGKFFKIDQVSKTKVPGNVWYQGTILNKGKMFDVKLPSDLPAGNYIIRHEIIALHLADSLNGAEFYPSCSNWKIGGSNTGTPNVTTTFPGGYKNTDPGIHINIWDNTDKAYPYPGPAIASFSGSSASSNSTSSSSNSSSGNDANDDSGSNDSNNSDGCNDENSGDDNNSDDNSSSGSNDNNSNDNSDDGCDSTTSSSGDVKTVYQTVTVTETVTATPSATAKARLVRDTSSATRRSRQHRSPKHN